MHTFTDCMAIILNISFIFLALLFRQGCQFCVQFVSAAPKWHDFIPLLCFHLLTLTESHFILSNSYWLITHKTKILIKIKTQIYFFCNFKIITLWKGHFKRELFTLQGLWCILKVVKFYVDFLTTTSEVVSSSLFGYLREGRVLALKRCVDNIYHEITKAWYETEYKSYYFTITIYALMLVSTHLPWLVDLFDLNMEVKGDDKYGAWTPRTPWYKGVVGCDVNFRNTRRVHFNCIHRESYEKYAMFIKICIRAKSSC